MARITWKNVAAPELSEYGQNQLYAARVIGDAANSIGRGVTGLDDRARDKQSAVALNQARQIQDVNAWDQMMANGGLAALGIAPDRANAALNNFVNSRRETLSGRRQDDYDYQRGMVEDSQDDWRFGRNQELALFEDWQNDRTKKLAGRDDASYEQSQAEAQMDQAAQDLAYAVADGRGIYDRDTAVRRIRSQTKGNPDMQEAALKYLEGIGDEAFSSSSNFSFDDETEGLLTRANQDIEGQLDEIRYEIGANEGIGLLQAGLEGAEGFGNALEGLQSRIGSAIQKEGLENEDEAIADNRRTTRKIFQDLKEKNPGMPDTMIVAAMERSWTTDDGVFFSGSKEQLDGEAAQTLLDKVDSVKDRNGLRVDWNDIQRRQTSLTEAKEEIETVSGRLAQAIEGGYANEEKRLRKRLNDIITEATGSDPDAAKALAEDALKSLIRTANADDAAEPGTPRPINADELLRQAADGNNQVDRRGRPIEGTVRTPLPPVTPPVAPTSQLSVGPGSSAVPATAESMIEMALNEDSELTDIEKLEVENISRVLAQGNAGGRELTPDVRARLMEMLKSFAERSASE